MNLKRVRQNIDLDRIKKKGTNERIRTNTQVLSRLLRIRLYHIDIYEGLYCSKKDIFENQI